MRHDRAPGHVALPGTACKRALSRTLECLDPAATVDGQVHDEGRTALIYIQSRKSNLLHFAHGITPEHDQAHLQLMVEDLMDGSYTVRWLSPETGLELRTDTALSVSGRLVTPVPEFRYNLVAILDSEE